LGARRYPWHLLIGPVVKSAHQTGTGIDKILQRMVWQNAADDLFRPDALATRRCTGTLEKARGIGKVACAIPFPRQLAVPHAECPQEILRRWTIEEVVGVAFYRRLTGRAVCRPLCGTLPRPLCAWLGRHVVAGRLTSQQPRCQHCTHPSMVFSKHVKLPHAYLSSLRCGLFFSFDGFL